MLRTKTALFLWAVVLCIGARSDAAENNLIGTKIDGFALKSQFGKEYSLDDLKDADVVVVAFLGSECPLAKLYGPRLAELAQRFKVSRVAFVGIDSNQQDSIEEMAAYAQRHHLGFPLLKDAGNKVADQFGAKRTPEVFVLDKDRKVRYRGRIDDQYGYSDGVGYQRPAAKRNDLAEAITELTSGNEISIPVTDVVGCIIGRIRQSAANSSVTYSNQIARLFQSHCVECHRPGQIGPFAMTSFAEVVGWGEMIREVVDLGRMPPWHANKNHGAFSNDVRLSDDDKKLIAGWVDSGCPEGNPADLPKPRDFTDGWAIGEPDQVVHIAEEVDVPAEGVIDYYHFVADPGWTEDKWIMAAEAKPGSRETVHHILVFIQPPGGGGLRGPLNGAGRAGKANGPKGNDNKQSAGILRPRGGAGATAGAGIGSGSLIAGYAPGMNPFLNTDGSMAVLAKAGSKIVFQMHYTPNGTPAKDRSYIGFRFADPQKVKLQARSTSVSSFLFAIPPGDSDYQVSAEGTFETDTLLANMTPHMHMRGKAFRYEAFYPNGEQEVLLDVPNYDFNWQTTYILKEPKLVPKGTKLVCTAHWDNSEENLSNPDSSKLVTWGSQSFEEMFIGFYFEVFPKGKMPARPSGGRGLGKITPDKVMETFDVNKDGSLTANEMPGPLGTRFQMVDANGDGSVSKQELEGLLKLISAFSGQRE